MEPTNQQPLPPVEDEKSAVGPTIALVVIILILLIGGLYFWSQNQNTNQVGTGEHRDADVTSLEADLRNSSLSETEDDLSGIDGEFEAQAQN